MECAKSPNDYRLIPITAFFYLNAGIIFLIIPAILFLSLNWLVTKSTIAQPAPILASLPMYPRPQPLLQRELWQEKLFLPESWYSLE